jgi:hypothetical protein
VSLLTLKKIEGVKERDIVPINPYLKATLDEFGVDR